MILPFADRIPVIARDDDDDDDDDVEATPIEVQGIPRSRRTKRTTTNKPRVKSSTGARTTSGWKPLVTIADLEAAAAAANFDSSSFSHNSPKRRKTTSSFSSTTKLIQTMDNMILNYSPAFDILAAMGHQETTRYNDKVDFLANAQSRGINVQIDQECRRKMAQWCYDVCETYHLSTEVVEVTMNMLDRFLITPAGIPALENRHTYQLACMTCLYTAIKAHETKVMNPRIVSTMSRGVYSEQDIVQMESTILMALQFRVHPPTSMSFVRAYLDVLTTTTNPALMTLQQRQTLLDLSALQIKAAISSYQFVMTPSSAIAYCCLINSMEALGMLDDRRNRMQIEWFLLQFVSETNASDLREYSQLLYSAIASCEDHVPVPSRLCCPKSKIHFGHELCERKPEISHDCLNLTN